MVDPVRTTETLITFRHPFVLEAIDAPQPAGTYRLVIEEEEIPGLSFVAHRRSATLLHLPALSVVSRSHQVIPLEPAEWAALLEADRRD